MAQRRNMVLPRQNSLLMPTVKNPFVHHLELPFMEKLKIALMTVTVFPVRLLLVSFLLLLCWPIAFVALWGRSEQDKLKPMKGWRRAMRYPLIFLGRACFFTMGFHYVHVIGQRANRAEAPVFVFGPHSTFFDAVAGFVSQLPASVSRAENVVMPLMGTLVQFTQPVLVSREDPNSRANTIKEIKRRAVSKDNWPQIAIFPEGTCTNRSCLITFKSGAFHPGVPVQPVLIRYPNKLDTVTWTWEGLDGFHCLWYTLCQFHTRIEVEFLPVYKPSAAEKENPRLFANNVRDVMAKCLGIPITDHTYDDCRLMDICLKKNLPIEIGLIEYNKIHSKLGMNLDTVVQLLSHYSEIVRDSCEGRIDINKFAAYLELPVSEALQDLFELYDRNGTGTIDFREYLIGVALVAQPSNTEETIQTAFKVFDPEGSGHITLSKLKNILLTAFNMGDDQVQKLFSQVDTENFGYITYDQFYAYAQKKPEYAKLFHVYQELHAAKQKMKKQMEEPKEPAKGKDDCNAFGSEIYLGKSFGKSEEADDPNLRHGMDQLSDVEASASGTKIKVA